MLADAFAARRALAADPRIDGGNIALVGFLEGRYRRPLWRP